jgi:hypothetical protein
VELAVSSIRQVQQGTLCGPTGPTGFFGGGSHPVDPTTCFSAFEPKATWRLGSRSSCAEGEETAEGAVATAQQLARILKEDRDRIPELGRSPALHCAFTTRSNCIP